MSLTDAACKNAKPKEKSYKLSDGNGMYLLVQPNGSKYWRKKYRIAGKEKLLSIGVYPEVSLIEARNSCLEARKLLKQGKDPSYAKKEIKRQNILKAENNFEAIAREWHSIQATTWTPHHSKYVLARLEKDIFPTIGNRPISEITPPELLEIGRKIEKRGAHEIAHRVIQSCGQVFRYAIVTGRAERNPALDLKGALKPIKHTHYAALDVKDLPEFIAKLNSNDARLFMQTRLAIHLLMLTFVRTGELRQAKWSEFDLEAGQWIIPAERMKMRQAHIVPLAKQAIEILNQLKQINGNNEWVFCGWSDKSRPMSNNAILTALKRLGYKDKTTGHGFRALAMTAIKEQLGYPHEVVDRQLAHAPKSKVAAAYDRSKFLDQRKKMMQDWADFIHAIKTN